MAWITSRRCVAPKRLFARGITADEIVEIIRAAFTAPDHCGLKSWRLVIIPDHRREFLGKLFASTKLEENPKASAEDLAKATSKALNGPILIAVIAAIVENHPQVPVAEQYIAIGAGLQNLLLAAHCLGYGAMITSGRKVGTEILGSVFATAKAELLICFITIGKSKPQIAIRPPIDFSNRLSVWS